jgi:hypothetical protein
MLTESSPSISVRETLTRSLLDVGRFFPTWSARMGRSLMAAVDEDGEADLGGAADIGESVEGGADGASGEEDIVDEDDGLRIDSRVSGWRWVRAPGRSRRADRRGTS